jgi:hypothetical protein
MSIINKIKLNYNLKLLDDLINNQKDKEILALLRETKEKNKDIFFHLLKHLNHQYSHKPNAENLFQNKLVLINSFQLDGCSYLMKFLKFYFRKTNYEYFSDNLADSIAADLDNMKLKYFPKQIDFNHMVESSDFFINSILLDQYEKCCFMTSNSAFFESHKKTKYFIYPNTAIAYFFIHDNPLKIFSHLKEKYSNTQMALNELCNMENSLTSSQKNIINHHVLENRQSWGIHAQSWLDPNVLNTYRGLAIGNEEFSLRPEEVLTKVIFHLIQAGLKIEINYKAIGEFVNDNKFITKEFSADISKKERKLLINNIDKKVLKDLEYEI